ncbi:hypothetical protein GMOD_00006401 [Pyrenophora seminiperda CCB06]|uniref:Arrestin-like N-terminal domain-containing protein n=1 Tax=Pyrenophora seminiperda CCB06 TaxID=1302712 RepID=A0A3M7M4Z9_9PLEO|nr:hypothetical protein GMOD_00006401 [Pyrenophora seminiperda CCB06]
MATLIASQISRPRQLYSYVAQPQLYSDHHHPDRQNTPDGPISIAFTRSSRRSIHTNNDLVKGVVHVNARLQVKHVTIKFVGKTTCQISKDRNPANQHIAETRLFCREQALSQRPTPSASCPPSRAEYLFEFRFPEMVEAAPQIQNRTTFKPDSAFECESGHMLPPSFWWNESTICNEYYLRAECVAESISFTLHPVVVHQLRFSPSVPEQGLPASPPLLSAPPLRFEHKSSAQSPDRSKERRLSLRRLSTGLLGGVKSENAPSTFLVVLSAPSQYRVGASSKIKLSLQATLSQDLEQAAPVYLRGIRAQAIAHIHFRIPVASLAEEEIRNEGIEKFDLFNQRYVKPGVEITQETVLDGFEINKLVPPTFKTYGVALDYDVKYNLLLDCAGKESEHEVEMKGIVVEPMTRPGGHLGPPEGPPPANGSEESFALEDLLRYAGENGLTGDEPPPYDG